MSIPAPASSTSTDDKLDRLLELLTAQATAAASSRSSTPTVAASSSPQAYAGPAGSASMSAPLAPQPEPAQPVQPAAPHPSESFVPGDLGFYSYHDHRDPEGVSRVQVVSVAHVDPDHVHAIVLGDASQLASFAPGQLTHAYPG